MAFSHPKFLKPAEELPDGRQGSPFDGQGRTRTFQKKFMLLAKVKEADVIDCCYAPGVPRPFSPYYSYDNGFTDELALLVKLSAQQDSEDWQKWVVTCNYSTDVSAETVFPTDPTGTNTGNPSDPVSNDNDPTTWMPQYTWDEETEMVTPIVTRAGRRIRNSANDPFRPGPSYPVSYPVFQMVRKERFLPREKLSQYNYVINRKPFMGAPAGYAMCMPIRASQVSIGRNRMWEATYRIKFHWMLDGNLRGFLVPEANDPDARAHNRSPFDPYILDAGYRYLAARVVNGVNIRVPTEFTPRPPEPELLDGAGNRARINPVNGERVARYLHFSFYREADFDKLFQNFNFNG